MTGNSPRRIGALSDGGRLHLVLLCAAERAIDAAQLAAVTANPVLVRRLNEAGFVPDDLVGITMTAANAGNVGDISFSDLLSNISSSSGDIGNISDINNIHVVDVSNLANFNASALNNPLSNNQSNVNAMQNNLNGNEALRNALSGNNVDLSHVVAVNNDQSGTLTLYTSRQSN